MATTPAWLQRRHGYSAGWPLRAHEGERTKISSTPTRARCSYPRGSSSLRSRGSVDGSPAGGSFSTVKLSTQKSPHGQASSTLSSSCSTSSDTKSMTPRSLAAAGRRRSSWLGVSTGTRTSLLETPLRRRKSKSTAERLSEERLFTAASVKRDAAHAHGSAPAAERAEHEGCGEGEHAGCVRDSDRRARGAAGGGDARVHLGIGLGADAAPSEPHLIVVRVRVRDAVVAADVDKDAAAPPAKQVLVEPLVLPILCVVPLLLRILHPHAGEGLATAVAAGRASARARRRSGDGSSPPTAAAAAAAGEPGRRRAALVLALLLLVARAGRPLLLRRRVRLRARQPACRRAARAERDGAGAAAGLERRGGGAALPHPVTRHPRAPPRGGLRTRPLPPPSRAGASRQGARDCRGHQRGHAAAPELGAHARHLGARRKGPGVGRWPQPRPRGDRQGPRRRREARRGQPRRALLRRLAQQRRRPLRGASALQRAPLRGGPAAVPAAARGRGARGHAALLPSGTPRRAARRRQGVSGAAKALRAAPQQNGASTREGCWWRRAGRVAVIHTH
mmetsp:Transcript_19809/g.58990  ORF Transcript_19809/g.58990 Transcript_19809/m.58990 type:complete len:563 (-) Transcript_19809:365-2053(-)